MLQVLFFAVLFAFALSFMGERGKPLLQLIDIASHALFGIVGDHHAGGAARRVRRDGVHHRPLRHRHAGCSSAS